MGEGEGGHFSFLNPETRGKTSNLTLKTFIFLSEIQITMRHTSVFQIALIYIFFLLMARRYNEFLKMKYGGYITMYGIFSDKIKM